MRSLLNRLRARFQSRSGFTFVEMLVASFISLLLLLGVLSSFNQHRVAYTQEGLEQELQQNLRSAMSLIHRDLRRCNSGLVMGTGSLGDWFSSLSGVSQLPHVVQSGNGRDELIVVGYPGESVGEISLGISSGAVTLTLSPNAALEPAYTPQVGDVLVLGSVEPVKVTAVLGNRISFTTDPASLVAGTRLSYPAGMEIYELSTVKYSLGISDGITGLKREDSRFTYATDTDAFVALHVESFDVSQTGDEVEIQLTGKTKGPVLGYTQEEDGYPRYTLKGGHTERNPQPKLSISSWDSDILMASTPVSSTPTPVPTRTPGDPTPTPAPQATATPVPQPTATPTPQPTATPVPQPTSTPRPHPSGKEKSPPGRGR